MTDDDALTHEWWWETSEEERQFYSSLSAGAAARFDDPETLFAFWRRDATTEAQRLYVEDLIVRVRRHLKRGTAARIHERPNQDNMSTGKASSISTRTLSEMDEAVRRLNRGQVGDPFDLEDVRQLLDEP